MNEAFSFDGIDPNSLSSGIIQKCLKFKNNCIRTTRSLIDKQKKEIKERVLEKESILRLLELQIPPLRVQNEEADQIINAKTSADKQLKAMVEERYKPAMNQLTDAVRRIADQISLINEEYRITSKQADQIKQMTEELQIKRVHADPFLRRRAQNLVKGMFVHFLLKFMFHIGKLHDVQMFRVTCH